MDFWKWIVILRQGGILGFSSNRKDSQGRRVGAVAGATARGVGPGGGDRLAGGRAGAMAGRACKEAVATLGAPSHGPALPSAPRLVPFCPRARPLGATSPPDPWGPAQHPSPDGGWLSPPSPAALMLSTPRAPKEWGDPISPRTGQRLRSSAGPPSGPLAPGSACPWAARATVPEGSGGAQGTRRLSASLSGSEPSVWASRAWAPSGDLGTVLGMRPEFRVPSPLLCPFLPISAGGSWLLRQVEGPGPRSLGSG